MPRKSKLDDPFSAHEALDRSHLAAMFFDENVAEHGFVQAHPKLKKVAEDLAERLAGFYQLVGIATMSPTPANLARELGISPKSLRQWLRDTFPRSPREKNASWFLTVQQVDAARARWKT